MKTHWFNQLILLTIILLATFLHLWQLSEFPAAISGDEAKNGLEGLLLLATPELRIFAPANAGREALYHYFLIIPLYLFGATPWALRLLPTMLSLLLLPLTYRWTHELLPTQRGVALLATGWLAMSPWMLNLSRLGLRGILLVPCMVAAYYFFWRGYHNQKPHRFLKPVRFVNKYFALSGFFLGLSLHTYTASRTLPLAFILMAIALSLYDRARLKTIWLGLLTTAATAMLIFAPLGTYFLTHPAAFLYRSRGVSLRANYDLFHSHTGQTFTQYLFMTWLDNLRWFVEMSQPWPSWFPTPLIYLCWFMGLATLFIHARRHANYAIITLSFAIGLLPIFIGLPTTMRVILAMPTTYIILALGAFSPFAIYNKNPHPQPLFLWKEERGDKNDSLFLWVRVGVRVFLIALLLLSSLALPDVFQPSRWIGQPPLPTPLDEVFTIAANRIRQLVLVEKRSVLVPQAIYGVPTTRFLLQENFSPTPPTNPAPTDPIALFWPTDWQRWFGATVPSFVLLSPSATPGQGYIETMGQWPPDRLAELEQVVQAQTNDPAIETIRNIKGQSLGHILALPRPQIALHATPHEPLKLQFGESLQLQGYEANLTKADTVDVALFLQLNRHVWTNYIIWLQLVDSHNRVVAEKRDDATDNPAYWPPHQLTIDHHALTAHEPLAEGVYVLKLGWLAVDFSRNDPTWPGQWLPVYDEHGRLWPATPTPLGLIQIGAPLEFAPMPSPLTFGNQLNLTGYKLAPGQTAHQFRLALQWQNDAPLNQDYTITIQLLDQNHRLIAQIDNPPLGGAYPTSTWQPRHPITDSYELELPPTVTPGDYLLVVGVYDWQTLQRLPITSDHEQLPELNLAILQHLTLK